MANPAPLTVRPSRAAEKALGWRLADAPWQVGAAEADTMKRPASPAKSAKLWIAALSSAALHFATAAIVVFGLPHIDLNFLKLRQAKIQRIDVVFYDPHPAEQVAPGTGAVAQEQTRLGMGSAETRGHEEGRNATRNGSEANRTPQSPQAPGRGQSGEGGGQAGQASQADSSRETAKPTEAKQSQASQASTQNAPQRPSEAATAGQRSAAAQQPPNTSSGGAGAAGKPDAKGQDERGAAQNRPAQNSENSQMALAAAAKSTANAGSETPAVSSPAPLAESLPILDRTAPAKSQQANAQAKNTDAQQGSAKNQAAQPDSVAKTRAQQAPARTEASAQPQNGQPAKSAEAAAQVRKQDNDQRDKGGATQAQVTADTPGKDAILPAVGAGASNQSGATASTASPATAAATPVRTAQAMTPPPADSSSNVAMKLMLQTLPGLDSTLAASIASPESVPVLPPTPRREQVIARMQKAANQGYAYAQYGVARRELIGQGVPRDPKAAADLLERAARQGYATAQLTLGYMALKGYGVKPNKSEALLWLTLAANQGNENAARAAALVEPTMTAQEVINARRQISEWKAVMGDASQPPAKEGKSAKDKGSLQDAIARGDLAAVRTLLARGEDANGHDREGRTAMINASWRGDSTMVDNLVEMGADPDIVDNEGRTAIMWAAGNGYAPVVEKLSKSGVELNLKDKQGRTAITSAAQNGYTDVVKILIANKADPNVRDENGKTALDYARKQNYQDIVQILEKVGAAR